MTDTLYVDYVWTDGFAEEVYRGELALARAQNYRELRGQGKIWRRFFRNGLLEGITDVTDVVEEENKP